MAKPVPTLKRESVIRLWLDRQGLLAPRGSQPLTPDTLTEHLERVGALQIDSVNVVDRAHYLTVWSRFGSYDRASLDRWIYDDRIAYEYWGHEASILPISHLPLGRRGMRRFPPPDWKRRSWWPRYSTSSASKARVLRRLRAEGPLESRDFERRRGETRADGIEGGMILPKEDKRSLKLLWHAGRVAVRQRRHFRCVYDLAENIYADSPIATPTEYEDSWLLIGLCGNGVATERHLVNYWTGPTLDAARRKRAIARNLRSGAVVKARVEGSDEAWYALPAHLDHMSDLAAPHGTTLLCPFDSALWQRKRAEQLLDFEYRLEIYTPAAKRKFGYYVLPILHDGKLVGRLDPKFHRDRATLEIKSIHFEAAVDVEARLARGLEAAIESLRHFLGAEAIELPPGWRRRLAL